MKKKTLIKIVAELEAENKRLKEKVKRLTEAKYRADQRADWQLMARKWAKREL